MDKRCGILIVSVTILVLCTVGTASATNWSVNCSGGADFTGIQDAINNAKDGDTIIAHSGVYYENVVVNKSVTLKGVGHPVVDAGGEGSAITLTADGITLVGFTATNAGRFQSDEGIKVTSNNNTITGNNVCNNNWGGIYLSSSSSNSITGNTVSSNGVGISLGDSSNNTITGNNIRNNNGRGISLFYSSNNNAITGNVFVNDGLFVYFSYQNIVEDNTVNGKPLVYLKDVSDYKVEDAGQVILVNCNNITIENLDLSNTSRGIALWKTENSKISNNTVYNHSGSGIGLYDSSNNIITGNNVCNNKWDGIELYDSNNNTIIGNNVCNNNDDGIFLYDSSNNTITGNNASNNNDEEGIHLRDSSNNTVTGNNVNNNTRGIQLQDSSNNNTITGNNARNNWGGIDLYDSSNNIITGNNVSNNKWDGIELYDSSNNIITGNNVSNNNWRGIRLDGSSNNSITGNNVSNNYGGIGLFGSCNNTIYFNNFINNHNNNVHDYYESTINIWNSPLEITYTYDGTTYKSYLGNYWNDYKGTDAEGDGIGDTHYSIYSVRDDYPLMTPFENYRACPIIRHEI